MRLPEDLVQNLLLYLTESEWIQLLSITTDLARTLLRRNRVIKLKDEFAIKFFLEREFREILLSLIVDPSKQLDITQTERVEVLADEEIEGFECSAIHKLICDPDFFDEMNYVTASAIVTIRSLILQGTNVPVQIFHHLPRVELTALILEKVVLPSRLLLSAAALEVLEIRYCRSSGSTIILLDISSTGRPKLRKLVVCDTNINNLEDFDFVEELHLNRLSLTSLPESFSQIPSLSISNCPFLTDLSMLQDNRDITVTGCREMTDISHCFSNTETIDLHLFHLQEPLRLDISYYQQCRRLSLLLDSNARIDEWCSQPTVSPNLTEVYLQGLLHPIPLHIFQTVQRLDIEDALDVELSLMGLENVTEVILRKVGITSLTGLGKNQKVIIDDCVYLEDFSPLRYVPTVEILNCVGFREVSQVDHVRFLRIRNCPFLRDVTPLGRVSYDPTVESYPIHSLTISECSKIRSIAGLAEVIPVLSVTDCRNLRNHSQPKLQIGESHHHNKSISHDKQSGMARATAVVGIFSLPERLFGIIFEYLCNEDVIDFLSSNIYLYSTLMKKYRKIIITANSWHDFFTDRQMVDDVLALMEDPYHQLQVEYIALQFHEDFYERDEVEPFRYDDIIDLAVSGFHRLEMVPDLFTFLCECCSGCSRRNPTGNEWWIKRLVLVEGSQDTMTQAEWRSLLPYLYKAREVLVIEKLDIPAHALTLGHFAPTLQELEIGGWVPTDGGGGILPVLPQLRKLTIRRSWIANLQDFTYLQELILRGLDNIESVEVFSVIPILRLLYLDKVSDITTLRDNKELEIQSCPRVRQFCHCFPMTKRLTIDLSRLYTNNHPNRSLTLDLSQYPELQEFTLLGANTMETFATPQQTEQLCSTEQLPAALKKVTLSDLRYFSCMNIYHSVQVLTLSNCPSVVSVEGLGSVRVLTLKKLANLTSLEGLQSNRSNSIHRNKIVTIEACPKIEDFSPLQRVDKVTLISCDGLRRGEDLEGVRDLTLRACRNIVDISMLIHAEALSMVDCRGIKEVGRVPEVVPWFDMD